MARFRDDNADNSGYDDRGLTDYMKGFFGGGDGGGYSSGGTGDTSGGSGTGGSTGGDTGGDTGQPAPPTAPGQYWNWVRRTRGPTDWRGGGSSGGGGSYTPAPWMGGGWQNPRGSAYALQQAFNQGLSGQQAVDWATANGAPGIAYYASKNQYGLPDGQYVAPNPQNPNQYDLIQRGGGGFGDPSYDFLNFLAGNRVDALGMPVGFPNLDAYMQQLQANSAAAKQRAQTFADQLTGRIGQLQQPLLSTADVANQQALASNNLLAQRDATIKNQQQQRYAQGFEPTSGLIAGDERATQEAYNNRQGQIDATLRSQQIQGDEQRRNEASQLQGLVQQALQGGDVTALQNQAQMADLENQLYNITQSRAREQLATANLPVELTNMGFANASNAANSGTDPLSEIFRLLSLGQWQQQFQQGQQNSNASGLAAIINWLSQAA